MKHGRRLNSYPFALAENSSSGMKGLLCFHSGHRDFVNIERASMNTQKGLSNIFLSLARPRLWISPAFAISINRYSASKCFREKNDEAWSIEKSNFWASITAPAMRFSLDDESLAYLPFISGKMNYSSRWREVRHAGCAASISILDVCAQTEFRASLFLLLLHSSTVCSPNEKANSKKLFARLRFLFVCSLMTEQKKKS